MRKVGGVSFSAKASQLDGANALFLKALDAVDSWLNTKGIYDESAEKDNFLLKDENVATLEKSLDDLDHGRLLRVRLIQRADSSVFETAIHLGVSDHQVGFSCDLRVGAPALGSEVRFVAHVPRLVRNIIGLTPDWTAGEVPITDRAINFTGSSGGSQLAEILWHSDRTLPVVVVSEHNGIVLSPGIHDTLAADLAGAAIVARADVEASWRLSAIKGNEWSCYNGAIRLYYPKLGVSSDPFRNPLWTGHRLLGESGVVSDAARRIRTLLRRKTLSFSAYATYIPVPLDSLESDVASVRLRAAKTAAIADKEWDELERLYGKENDRLKDELKRRDEEISDLRTQVSNLQASLSWREPEDEDAPKSEATTPPATIQEAIDRAKALFDEELVFGGDVDSAVEELDGDAGPPEKILKYLEALADMTKARRAGPLGTGMLAWLSENRGVTGSDESETVRNSAAEMKKRTFNDGFRKRRQFTLHLKPSEATSPNRCVRVYFDFDDSSKKMIIAHVGRHP